MLLQLGLGLLSILRPFLVIGRIRTGVSDPHAMSAPGQGVLTGIFDTVVKSLKSV